jgi:formamidopyrimidine-DNA glycosylase
MPELPEVETTVKGLRPKILKRTIIDVWSDWRKLVKKPRDFGTFKKIIKNKKIIKIWRRAKNIIFDLSDGYSLLVHQKMTGHLMFGQWKFENNKWKPVKKGPLKEKINTFLHIIFFLDNEKMIALSDVRKFAKIELWKTEKLLDSEKFKKIGPEPLEKNFTFEKFKNIFKNKKGRIKQLIMNPEIIAGIGNIYSSEALWWAKIHPEKNVTELNNKELNNLYKAIKKVLELSVKLGGESFSDYRKPDGSKGNFDTERKAYKREGQKCYRCGTLISRLKFAGRSAFFCPHCQKL